MICNKCGKDRVVRYIKNPRYTILWCLECNIKWVEKPKGEEK